MDNQEQECAKRDYSTSVQNFLSIKNKMMVSKTVWVKYFSKIKTIHLSISKSKLSNPCQRINITELTYKVLQYCMLDTYRHGFKIKYR